MKHEFKHRWSGDVLFGSDTAESRRVALEEALRSGADLRGAYLGGADLRGADLGGANLRGADLGGANLRGAYMGGANLGGANLSGANLSGANLSGANLRGANLRAADLRGANLRGANLRAADLRAADLRGANLRGANLRAADLRDADLRGADLRDADLRGADLRDADLRGADLRGAQGVSKYLTSPLYMLFDQAGPIRSYKLVNAEMEGPYRGGIKYQIGVTVVAEEADTDESRECAAGINVATLDWCLREWRVGYKILLVEHEVSDIACIPIGSDGKYRVHRCRVIAEKDLSQIGISEVAKAEL